MHAALKLSDDTVIHWLFAQTPKDEFTVAGLPSLYKCHVRPSAPKSVAPSSLCINLPHFCAAFTDVTQKPQTTKTKQWIQYLMNAFRCASFSLFPYLVYQTCGIKSNRFYPRCNKSNIKSSKSPSNTASESVFSVPVRTSLTNWYGYKT